MSEASAGPTVLYVDDEKNNRLIFMHTLKDRLSIRLADSPAEALELLAHERVDILLADLRMPELSGAELAREVRERHPRLPIFIVTGYPNDEELSDLLATQIVRDVFTKPWDPDQLCEAFQRALAELRVA